jgi:hypothetical protein
MAMPMTAFEFLLGGDPERVVDRLAELEFLSEGGGHRREEVLAMIERARAEWDPEETGPSYVHRLALDLFAAEFISKKGMELHKRGPQSLVELMQDPRLRTGEG